MVKARNGKLIHSLATTEVFPQFAARHKGYYAEPHQQQGIGFRFGDGGNGKDLSIVIDCEHLGNTITIRQINKCSEIGHTTPIGAGDKTMISGNAHNLPDIVNSCSVAISAVEATDVGQPYSVRTSNESM